MQSSSQIINQQTNIQFFYRPNALPVTQPTVSKHSREKYHIPWTCLPQAHLRVFLLCLWPLIAPGYLREGCHASHQPSDASTPTAITTNNLYSPFRHVERKDDNHWVKRCITWEVEGIRQTGRPKKTWWDCVKNDLESLGLSQNDAQSRNKWRSIKGATD